MKKNIYLGLALAVLMSCMSMVSWAEVAPAPEAVPQVTSTATTPDEHKQAVDIEKQQAEHHQAMVVHHKSIAKEYGKAGQHELKTHHEEMAKHHEALAKEHEKTATTHKKLVKGSDSKKDSHTK